MNEMLLKERIREMVGGKDTLAYDIYEDVIKLGLQLKQEGRVAYYGIDYTDDEDNDFHLLTPLTEAQVDEIKQAAVVDGEEVDYDDILADLSDKDYLYAEGPCGGLTPFHIELDAPSYLYDIEVAVFPDGLRGNHQVLERKVQLTDEEYIWLVGRYMCAPYMSFNWLRFQNRKLYDKICEFVEDNIESDLMQFYTPTYAVELTELKQDAALYVQCIGECIDASEMDL